MSDLKTIYQAAAAQLAPDGIPLHFGDIQGEYTAAFDAAILLDRSHEGRLRLVGKDSFDLINRMSTNNMLNLAVGEGCGTVFANPNGRILDRVVGYHLPDGDLLMLAGPGRGEPLRQYLQRNIFFNDDVKLTAITAVTRQFALHGPASPAIIAELVPAAAELTVHQCVIAEIAGCEATITRGKPYSAAYYTIITSVDDAAIIWQAIVETGRSHALKPSGGLVYNALRIRSGVPGTGRELSADYIPLEVGLWDEISFNKGCYTGQEIIARMESRERVARTIIHVTAEQAIAQGAELYADGKRVGMVTSSVTTPANEHVAIAVVKVVAAQPGSRLHIGELDGPEAAITTLLGEQPPFLMENS